MTACSLCGLDPLTCDCHEPQQPRPSAEEECAGRGHRYYGDRYPDAPDGQGGSCWCGDVTFPTGGPA